jgi:hypothetical protein
MCTVFSVIFVILLLSLCTLAHLHIWGIFLSHFFFVEFIFLFLVLDFLKYLQQHSDHAFLQFLFTVKDSFAGCRNLVRYSLYFRAWNILFCAILSIFCKVCCYSDRFTFIYDSLLLS